jgi:hypothetical protein
LAEVSPPSTVGPPPPTSKAVLGAFWNSNKKLWFLFQANLPTALITLSQACYLPRLNPDPAITEEELVQWYMPVIPALRGLRQEDGDFRPA